ncbi:MAG: methyltransferase regulatory domain-containing protein [Dehalococcoidia bacterium]
MPDAQITEDYATVPYPSWAHVQAQPDRLATIARLHGLQPAPVDRCRVLELGCGDGGNLLPLAARLPGSRFIGIDLAADAIARGIDAAAELDLTNVELAEADLSTYESDEPFDYIIAHGLFSWVPPEVQEATLALCQRLLAPQGVAYLSYTTLPGGHIRLMAREMMLFHAGESGPPAQRMAAARELLTTLTRIPPQPGDPYAAVMVAEAERILARDDAVVFHDELSAYNEPVYLTELLTTAAEHGLQFLGEADYYEMFDRHFPEAVLAALDETRAQSRVLGEQYLDFLRCRRFRKTLLCRDDAPIHDDPDAAAIGSMWVASKVQRVMEPAQPLPPGAVQFRNENGAAFTTDDAAIVAAIRRLGESFPQPVPFASLLEGAGRYATQADRGTLAERLQLVLLSMYQADLAELSTVGPAFLAAPGSMPAVSPWARRQAASGLPGVTSLAHGNIWLSDELMRRIIVLADGTRDRAALVAALEGFLPADGAEARRKLFELLQELGRSCLLLPGEADADERMLMG